MKRFWDKVDKSGDCWMWKGAIAHQAYGIFRLGSYVDGSRRSSVAHRVAWELTNGPIPKGLQALHKCDVQACVNPAHLFLGTQKDNMDDMVRKNRRVTPRGERNGQAKMTDAVARTAKILLRLGVRRVDIARWAGVTATSINQMATGRSWKHIKAA